ncbi:MAG: cation:proton antiporter [Rhodobacteraceae bacterium]|nr:cation:proton antiporter [Paracoccaceae bacterium]
MTPSEFLMNAMDFSIGLVILAIAIGFIRIVRGPTLADRVVALDMMTTTIAAFCALVSVRAGVSSFVDVGIVVALVGFLATVALARYAERQRILIDPPEAPKDDSEVQS